MSETTTNVYLPHELPFSFYKVSLIHDEEASDKISQSPNESNILQAAPNSKNLTLSKLPPADIPVVPRILLRKVSILAANNTSISNQKDRNLKHFTPNSKRDNMWPPNEQTTDATTKLVPEDVIQVIAGLRIRDSTINDQAYQKWQSKNRKTLQVEKPQNNRQSIKERNDEANRQAFEQWLGANRKIKPREITSGIQPTKLQQEKFAEWTAKKMQEHKIEVARKEYLEKKDLQEATNRHLRSQEAMDKWLKQQREDSKSLRDTRMHHTNRWVDIETVPVVDKDTVEGTKRKLGKRKAIVPSPPSLFNDAELYQKYASLTYRTKYSVLISKS